MEGSVMNALLGLSAPRQFAAQRPQGTAPDMRLAGICFIAAVLLLAIWLGEGWTLGRWLATGGVVVAAWWLSRLLRGGRPDAALQRLAKVTVPEAEWKDALLKGVVLDAEQRALLVEALRDWLMIRRRYGAPLPQPSRYVQQLWLALFNQPGWLEAVGERRVPPPPRCNSGNGLLSWMFACALQEVNPRAPAFLPRLWCVDVVIDKGEFAAAAAQAKCEVWAAAFVAEERRRRGGSW